MTTCPINEPKTEYSCPMHGKIAPVYSKDTTAAIPICPICGCSVTVIYVYESLPVLWCISLDKE